MQTTISLLLPEPFREACQTLCIPSEVTIQRFIDHVSVYAHITKRGIAPDSIASHVFNCFVTSKGRIPTVDHPVKRELGIYYLRRVVRLIDSEQPASQKQAAYHELLEEWYAALIKIDQP